LPRLTLAMPVAAPIIHLTLFVELSDSSHPWLL
jgi:hypothetical protein